MRKLLIIRIKGRLTGIVSDEISEILPMPMVTSLPEPLPGVMGTALVGGKLTTLIDTASILGETHHSDQHELLIRMAQPNEHLALPVSSIEHTLTYEPLKIKEESTGIWRGLYPWGENLINVLQLPGLVEELTRKVSSAVHVHSAGRGHGS